MDFEVMHGQNPCSEYVQTFKPTVPLHSFNQGTYSAPFIKIMELQLYSCSFDSHYWQGNVLGQCMGLKNVPQGKLSDEVQATNARAANVPSPERRRPSRAVRLCNQDGWDRMC